MRTEPRSLYRRLPVGGTLRKQAAALSVLFGGLAVALAAPVVTTVTPSPNAQVGTLTQISVVFSEPVTGVEAADLEIGGRTPASVSGSGSGPYVFEFTEPEPGTIAVTWDADHGIAGIGTGSFEAGAGWSYTLSDTAAPSIGRITSSVPGQDMPNVRPAPGATVGVLSEAHVTFSEAVTGVQAASLQINGQPSNGVAGSGAGPYVFTFEPPPDGPVSFEWAQASGIVDAVGLAFDGAAAGWSVIKAPTAGTVAITEFLAANGGVMPSPVNGVRDEEFDLSPWVELTNTGDTAVDLTGWSLARALDQAGQWFLPTRTLAPGARLVVWCSGKDRRPASGHLHANFEPDVEGGTLALFGPDAPAGPPVSAFVDYPGQRFDHSYGLQAGDGAPRYFSPPSISQSNYTLPTSANPTPTPPVVPQGQPNGASNLTALLAQPTASVTRGLFDQPFSLILSAEPGATIHFTLTGSPPTTNDAVYAGPLRIERTTVLRAAAFSPTRVPSTTVTHSYLFPNTVAAQPSPPYNNPASTTDDSNPDPPSVGGAPLPVHWGTNTTGGFPGRITNLAANQVPADYGMDPKVVDDPTRYADDGTIDAEGGLTNRERIQRALRTLPSLSLVLKSQDMFGSGGLYPTASESDKTDRTKACSLELLLPDGTTAFDVPCGIDLHGNASRAPYKNPKHGFTLRFKGRYGATKLEAALFPGSPVRSWDKLVLRGDFNSSWLHQNGQTGLDTNSQRPRGIRIRDAWCKDTFRDMGRHAGRHRYTNLYINGIFWGTYDLAEDQDADFAASAFGGDKADYDIIDQGILKSGTWTSYRAMKAILGWTGSTQTTVPSAAVLSSPFTNTQYEQIKQHLDVPWFADYMIHHFFTGHQDWATTADYNKNWYAVRHRQGTFRYLPWDQENLLWGPTDNRVTGAQYPPTAIHPRLRQNAEYRLNFADRVHRHCVAPDGALQPAANIARLDRWTAIMGADALCLESARWGDYRYQVHRYNSGVFTEVYTWNGRWFENGTLRTNTANTNHWIAEINRLRTSYFPVRTANLLGQLRSAGLYPALNAPQCRDAATDAVVGSRHVPAGWSLRLTQPDAPPAGTTNAGTLWFTTDGSDPRVAYDTTGARTPSARVYETPILVPRTTTIKARALDGTTWSALMEATFTVGSSLPAVRISEIHYNPPASQGGGAAEFIEIHNAGENQVAVGHWSFEGVNCVIPFDLKLGPGDRAVFISNDAPAVFAALHPGVVVAGTFGGSLNNGGERLSLLDAGGRVVDAVDYGDEAPWPAAPDNGGFSLERIDAHGDAQAPSNWRASVLPGGTPGRNNAGHWPPGPRISELFLRNAGAYVVAGARPGFVEIHNQAAAAADLGGWTLGFEGGGNITFTHGTQVPSQGTLLVEVGTTGVLPRGSLPVPTEPQGFLFLSDPAGAVLDGLRFGPQVDDYSFGRTENGWRLGPPSPGASHVATFTAPATALRLNEWLAAPGPGEDDWIELYNTHASLPIVLTGMEIGRAPLVHRHAAASAVAPAGLVRLWANPNERRPDSLPFSLPSGGATLTLADASGTSIDSVTYGPQQTGLSEGRLPDGSDTLTVLAAPSPGLSNHGPIPGSPVINEVLAHNENGENAPWARRPSWIELRNPHTTPVDLAGWRLRTQADGGFTFPPGVSLAPHELLAIWCDPDHPVSHTASSHLNSGLSLVGSQAGRLELCTPAGQIADRLSWGPQVADQSIGRQPSWTWQLLAHPTRARPNSEPAPLGDTTALRLNEWRPTIGADRPEFIELYNPSPNPVDLAGLWLSDEPSLGGRRKWQVPSLSFAPAGGHAYFGRGSDLPASARYTFTLSAGGESARLGRNDTATTAIDETTFGSWLGGERSHGRSPDGSDATASLLPTPGWSNDAATGPVITHHPTSTIAPLGSAVSFNVATANPAAHQWRFNGLPLTGQTGHSLTLASVGTQHDGLYVCDATDATGTTTSRAARLTVLYTYPAWANLFQAGPVDADDDGDGATNGLEFLLGHRPDRPEAPAPGPDFAGLVGTVENPLLAIEVWLDPRASFSRLAGETSAELTLDSWRPQLPTAVETGPPDADGRLPTRLLFAVPPASPRHFLRLSLEP
jgi:hypothetical protein